MDFVNVNLTPGRFFLNLQLKDVIIKLQEVGYTITLEYDSFLLLKNSEQDIIKLRRDGTINYRIPIEGLNEAVITDLIKKISSIINTLNSVYGNLLSVDETFIYWPDNLNFNDLLLCSKCLETINLSGNKYTSMVKKNMCLHC